ncbi:hypothetical protein NL676_009682 [Syzygium grande]|nr:hypothetical protein NL676_009682 [Syzygium grande]
MTSGDQWYQRRVEESLFEEIEENQEVADVAAVGEAPKEKAVQEKETRGRAKKSAIFLDVHSQGKVR